jgi:hypothetical protein
VITLGEIGTGLPSRLASADLSDLWLRRDVFAAAGLVSTNGSAMRAPYVARLSRPTSAGLSDAEKACAWAHCPNPPPVGRHAATANWVPCPQCR